MFPCNEAEDIPGILNGLKEIEELSIIEECAIESEAILNFYIQGVIMTILIPPDMIRTRHHCLPPCQK